MTEPLLPLDPPDTEPPRSTAPARRFGWRKKLGVAAALLLALLAALWWLPSPRTTDAPVTWSRNPDGSFTTADTPPEAGALEVHAASVKASNSSSRSSSSTHSGADFFPSDSITVLNFSDSLLMKRAADELVEALKQQGDFTTVTHFPAGHQPEPGRRSDLYLTMDLKRLTVGGLASREVEADIHLQLGPSPVNSRHSYSNGLTPPTLEFHAHIELEHRSTLTGVESSAARFKLQGANIAEAIAAQIMQEISDRREEERPLPSLPDGFFPDWEPAPEFAFLSELQAEQRLSFHGCCLVNETLWSVNADEGLEQIIPCVHAELSDVWQGTPGEGAAYLRMSRDAESIEVFPQRDGAFMGEDSPSACWIRYRRVLDSTQREQLFESLLTEDHPRSNLLMSLDRMGNREQRERALALADSHPPSTATAWVNLAGRYFSKQRRDDGIMAVQCANLLARIRNDDVRGQIDNLLKKNKLDRDDTLTINRAVLERLGLVDVTSATGQLERPLASGLAGVFWLKPTADNNQTDGKSSDQSAESFRIAGITVSPPTTGTNERLSVSAISLQEGSSSWTSDSMLDQFDWEHTFPRRGKPITFRILKDDPTQVIINLSAQ